MTQCDVDFWPSKASSHARPKIDVGLRNFGFFTGHSLLESHRRRGVSPLVARHFQLDIRLKNSTGNATNFRYLCARSQPLRPVPVDLLAHKPPRRLCPGPTATTAAAAPVSPRFLRHLFSFATSRRAPCLRPQSATAGLAGRPVSADMCR